MVINKLSSDIKTINSAQIRAGRALLKWNAQDLADRAKIGVATVRRAEATEGDLQITEANADAIKRALEDAGIKFISPNGGGAGVRLRNR